MGEAKIKYPYAVGLKSELEAKKSCLVCEEMLIVVKDCRFLVEVEAINIKAWL